MQLVEWNDRFSVQIESVDSQHKVLFALLNKLFDAMKADREDEIIEAIINELEDYAKVHFAAEETYFRQYKYENKEEHKKEHGTFINKLSEFRKGFKAKKSDISSNILFFLREWLYNHIMISDNKYKELLLSKGVK